MTRILPENVVEAFQRRNISSRYRTSWVTGDSVFCAAGGLAFDKLDGDVTKLLGLTNSGDCGYDTISELLGVSKDYLKEFTAGFDGREHEITVQIGSGVEDGQAARIALAKAGLYR